MIRVDVALKKICQKILKISKLTARATGISLEGHKNDLPGFANT
jgi:hypothetical protein